MIQDIQVPEIGENVESGVVVAVHVKAGEKVAVDDTVIELETDKALVEIPSPFSGRITEVLIEAGAQMNVGDVIARVETDAQQSRGEPAPAAEPDAEPVEDPAPMEKEGDLPAEAESDEAMEAQKTAAAPDRQEPGQAEPDAFEGDSGRASVPAAPSIRRMARELGVDIRQISGSGSGGRISEADLKAHVRQRMGGPSPAAGAAGAAAPALPDFSRWGPVETEELATVRRLTAGSTATAWTTIPHVTQFDEADITGVTAFIEKNAPKAQAAGIKLTVTAVIARICADALKRFPQFNASIDLAANRIIFKHYVHIGIAADTPRGLLVPVIRDADRKSIIELARSIGDMSRRAREKKIKPDEMEGGTFTISNQGGIGGVGFTPIVFWPQVAILGVSRSALKPVYIRDRFEPRTVLPLSLSYDHRLIDGADAARFLRWICEGLEQPLTLLLE
jgi:pyruvate dehydrogenase E2 component (dihydrolipoamide acetyltransferase)